MDNQKPQYHKQLETLDCSGAGMCQPLPDETTDGGKQQAMVQKAHDKRRSKKRKQELADSKKNV